jgi:hypothetical protein
MVVHSPPCIFGSSSSQKHKLLFVTSLSHTLCSGLGGDGLATYFLEIIARIAASSDVTDAIADVGGVGLKSDTWPCHLPPNPG